MKVMISAGEASGDIHAAELVRAMKKRTRQEFPDHGEFECFGMGGRNLAKNGVELLVDVENNAVMGLLEVLHKYPTLRSGLATLRRALTDREPDVLILVDYPGFNMKLAATARELGIPVLYFIAPKVWASRAGRVNELKKLVDHVALILPFEKKIFDEAEVPATYVGNPLLDNHKLVSAANTSVKHRDTKQIVLMPGSRKSEVSMLLPPMLEACEKLLAQTTESDNFRCPIDFVLPVADTIQQQDIEAMINAHKVDVRLIAPDDYTTLRNSSAALVASGTATLELAILGIPMVVIYKLNTISYQVIKRMLTTQYISLVNIMADNNIVPEILQDDVTAKNLAHEMSQILFEEDVIKKQREGLAAIYEQLGKQGASDLTAELALSMVRDKSAELAAS